MVEQGLPARSDAAMTPGSPRFLFRTFKRILACNTAALERMAQMDHALSGEYVFDQAFLDSAVRDVCGLTHRVAYHLNGMTGEGRLALYDVFLSIKDSLEDILAGGMGPLADRAALPFSEIGWEMEPLVGLNGVGLAVLGHKVGLPAPDGMAVTVTGMQALEDKACRESALAAIQAELAALLERRPGPAALELTCMAAQVPTAAGHEPLGEHWPGRILACAEASGAADVEAALQAFLASFAAAGPLAVCITRKLPARVRGTLQTLAHDPHLPPAMLAIAHPPDAPEAGDRFWISRSVPHACLRSRILPKPITAGLPNESALAPGKRGLAPGSARLLPTQLAQLAELGLAAERALGGPVVISWAIDRAGALQLTGMEPVRAPFPEWDLPETDYAITAAAALLRGGQIACQGVAAGPVVLLDEDTPAEAVPLGAVGVSRTASPALSRHVPRLAALLTETGSAASHLATVAREHRTPALFGLAGAVALPVGELVTVDAEQQTVHLGVQESLLRLAAIENAQPIAAPEFLVLRRLLRYIRPLNLIDPAAPSFTAAHCQTLHDILHYAHETAVDLLLGIAPSQDRKGTLGVPHQLDEDAPIELDIVDIGDALSPEAGKRVTLQQVRSLPLRAFLEGLLLREVRRQDPGRLSLGDIIAGLGRTSRAMTAPAAAVGRNLALAARDYANITLRLGYHFSVVDAVISPRPEHTFIYFRYAGGFADDDRRARRARLIVDILDRLRFKTSQQGDLVVGKRKLLEGDEAQALLRLLGALSAFTRQLDVELTSEAEIAGQTRAFLEACRAAGLWDAARPEERS